MPEGESVKPSVPRLVLEPVLLGVLAFLPGFLFAGFATTFFWLDEPVSAGKWTSSEEPQQYMIQLLATGVIALPWVALAWVGLRHRVVTLAGWTSSFVFSIVVAVLFLPRPFFIELGPLWLLLVLLLLGNARFGWIARSSRPLPPKWLWNFSMFQTIVAGFAVLIIGSLSGFLLWDWHTLSAGNGHVVKDNIGAAIPVTLSVSVWASLFLFQILPFPDSARRALLVLSVFPVGLGWMYVHEPSLALIMTIATVTGLVVTLYLMGPLAGVRVRFLPWQQNFTHKIEENRNADGAAH